jgi:hypothetical protein
MLQIYIINALLPNSQDVILALLNKFVNNRYCTEQSAGKSKTIAPNQNISYI